MENAKSIEKKIRELKPELEEKFHVNSIGLFGSFSTGKNTQNSDIDLLVDFSGHIGWRLFDLKEYLEKVFGRKVDLVTKNSLKKRLRTSIMNQVRYL